MTIWVNRSTNWSLKAHLLVGKTKPTGAYIRRSKKAGIAWSTSTNAARCARRML
jgi:hypothetical protein